MGAVLVWWLVVQLVGLLALPLTYWVFKGLPDRGYAFARPLGLLLAGYVFWLAGNLGLLRNSLGGVIVALMVLAALSLYFGRRELGLGRRESDDSPTLWQFIRDNKAVVIATELIFFLVLALWVWYRSYSPDIATSGGEKFMEYAFINAILRSPTLPPADPWLSGFAISYYHFGYIILSMLIRLSGLASNIAFNLSLSLLFALTLTGAFSLVYNLVRLGQRRMGTTSTGKAIGFGVLGGVLLGIMGNLEGFFERLYARGIGSAGFWRWLDIRNLSDPPVGGAALPERYLWWWRASRVLQDYDPLGNSIEIIDEFPFFSFMLGDIHPHVLALPFAMLMLALALNLLADRDGSLLRGLKSFTPLLVLYAVCLGGMAFLNTWDFPLYLGIVGLAFMARLYIEEGAFTRKWLLDAVTTLLLLAVLGVIFYLPFYIGFQSQAGGPTLNLWAKTLVQHYLVMFGVFIFIFIGMLAAVGTGVVRKLSTSTNWRPSALVIGGIATLLVAASLTTGRWLALLLSLLMAFAAFCLWRLLQGEESDQLDLATIFALLLMFVGLGLTWVIEFVFLKDTFGNRMNTIFKFYFQAWTLMAVSGAYGVYYVLRRTRAVGRYLFGAGFIALLLAGLVYPIFAAPNRAGNFQREPTLDGITYTAQYWPGDYAATEWLKATVKEPAVILEANGGSYTQYGRVSAMTGIPTLLGWGGHELQWRGSYDEPGRREPDIEKAYHSMDVDEVKAILDEYNVTYVYVGQLEREKFRLSDPMIDKFGAFMDLVYEGQGVRIYQVRGK